MEFSLDAKKGGLYKVLTAGVPMNAAAVILVKTIISLN